MSLKVFFYIRGERGELDIVRLKVVKRLPDTYVCYICISDIAFRDGYKTLKGIIRNRFGESVKSEKHRFCRRLRYRFSMLIDKCLPVSIGYGIA